MATGSSVCNLQTFLYCSVYHKFRLLGLGEDLEELKP